MKRLAALVAGIALALAASAADEDKDLDLIPGAPKEAASPAPAASDGNQRIYVENAAVFAARREALLVPSPAAPTPRWEDHLLADARMEWAVTGRAQVAYSGRLELRDEEGMGFLRRANVVNDLRELFASVEPRPREYLDAGRINMKTGVALGFNPTDFFKSRAVIDPLTSDPRALREDRLGTVMIRGQVLGEQGSLATAYAPHVTHEAALGTDPDRGFDALLGRTNAHDRWLAKAGVRLGEFNPEALIHRERGVTSVGLNLAESVGQATVVYFEWAGARRRTLSDDAIAFARDHGLLPTTAPGIIDHGGGRRFRNQLALGGSYTTENRITFNLEWHENEAAFSQADWQRWFGVGDGQPAASPITRQLWLLRAYASERQEPLQRHAVFLRADAVDFLVPKLELTGFVLADAGDGSTLMQLEASYARSDHWSFGALVGGTAGGKRSNFGSLSRAANLLLRATRYF